MIALDLDTGPAPEQALSAPTIDTPDHLGYMADMILELQAQAQAHRLDLLAGLLRCAHDEAMRKLQCIKRAG